MNRREIISKALGLVSVFLSCESQARRNVTWPSKLVSGSVQSQTIELKMFLKRGFVINCRPGVFVLDNAVRIDVSHVDIRGAKGSEKTVLRFLDQRKGGLILRGADYVNISDIHLYWDAVDSNARSHWGAGLMLIKSKNINVSFSSVHGAPGAGFHFNQSQSISVRELFVENTLADGIHFQNSSNCKGYSLITKNTGDDGVSIVDYQKLKRSSGFYLERITVIGSKARGIAFVGARNGVLTEFLIDKTASNGLHIEQDVNFNTRISEDIRVFSGRIDGVGKHYFFRKNRFGINILRAKNIELEMIEINKPERFGCFISDSSDISVSNFQINFSRSTSIFVLNTRRVFFSNIRIFSLTMPVINLVGVVHLSAVNIAILDKRNDLTKKAKVAIALRPSKKMPLSDIDINDLILEVDSDLISKVFTIKSGDVSNVKIKVFSKNKVKVLGGATGLSLFRLQKI